MRTRKIRIKITARIIQVMVLKRTSHRLRKIIVTDKRVLLLAERFLQKGVCPLKSQMVLEEIVWRDITAFTFVCLSVFRYFCSASVTTK